MKTLLTVLSSSCPSSFWNIMETFKLNYKYFLFLSILLHFLLHITFSMLIITSESLNIIKQRELIKLKVNRNIFPQIEIKWNPYFYREFSEAFKLKTKTP